jgi:hypothetical protein
VAIRAGETAKGRYWVRSYGLCKFRRAELELRELPFELVEGARSLLMEAAEEAATGSLYREGDLVGSPRQPMMLVPSATTDDEQREVLGLVDVTTSREPAGPGAVKGVQALMHDYRV